MSESQRDVSRRDLFKNAGILGAGSILAATTGVLAAEPIKGTAAQPSPEPASLPVGQPVPRRVFGKTGVEVARPLSGRHLRHCAEPVGSQASPEVGHHLLGHTAHGYVNGNSERGIGMHLEREPQTRKDIFLVTKSGASDAKRRDEEFRESLERLKTDYVDLFFVHGPKDAKYIEEHADEWKQWAEKAKARQEDQVLRLLHAYQHGGKPVGSVQTGLYRLHHVEIRLPHHGPKRYEDRRRRLRQGRYRVDGHEDPGRQEQAFRRKPCEPGHGGSVRQEGLHGQAGKPQKRCGRTRRSRAICSQMANLTVLASNYLAAIDKTQMSSSERQLMDQYASASCSSYCAGCSNICEPAVGSGLPIADVMRFLMYHHDYDMVEHARTLFAGLSARRPASNWPPPTTPWPRPAALRRSRSRK